MCLVRGDRCSVSSRWTRPQSLGNENAQKFSQRYLVLVEHSEWWGKIMNIEAQARGRPLPPLHAPFFGSFESATKVNNLSFLSSLIHDCVSPPRIMWLTLLDELIIAYRLLRILCVLIPSKMLMKKIKPRLLSSSKEGNGSSARLRSRCTYASWLAAIVSKIRYTQALLSALTFVL